ncbi:unnamed protein product [Rhodiola kirilowii]
MANSTNSHKPKATTSNKNKSKRQQQKPKQKPNPSPTPISPSTPSKPSAPSWSVIRSILSCKHVQTQQQAPQLQTPPQKLKQKQKQHHMIVEQSGESSNSSSSTEAKQRSKKMRCSGSICDNTKVMQRPELMSSIIGSSFHTTSSVSEMTHSSNSSASHNIPSSSSNSNNNNNNNVSSGSSGFKGMPFRRFTGCYECRLVVDPVVLGFTRDPSLRSTVCSCPDCGEVFMKAENLETHQAVRHAVSELGPEDTSRNIVEIIFQSSWQKKQMPVCKIDRILKVQNTPKTISNFESYRESIKSKANKTIKKHQRCIADGNELLRFHSTTLQCSLGLNGSTNLCDSISKQCTVCSVIRNGFRLSEKGILTTATSGRADDKIEDELLGGGRPRMEVRENPKKRAMLVCRVIAGRVKRENSEEFDSVSDGLETYSSLDELYVFDQKAILPCFVVIYGEES